MALAMLKKTPRTEKRVGCGRIRLPSERFRNMDLAEWRAGYLISTLPNGPSSRDQQQIRVVERACLVS